MSTDLSRTIGELVLARLGFSPTDLLWQRFSRVVQQQARHAGFPSPEDYLRHLVRASDDELEQLAEALTINETYFFREAKHFDALRQLLPELARETRTVRLLSAGCASGEEAYSLAITAHRVLQPAGIDFEVVGVDIDRRAIERARAGRYRQWSFREHGLEHAQPYVRQVQGWWVVREDIRQHVRFEHLNLTERLPPGPFHVVFCRNTLMYLTAANRRDVVARLAELLPPGGLLVIGSAETLDVLPPRPHPRHDRWHPCLPSSTLVEQCRGRTGAVRVQPAGARHARQSLTDQPRGLAPAPSGRTGHRARGRGALA